MYEVAFQKIKLCVIKRSKHLEIVIKVKIGKDREGVNSMCHELYDLDTDFRITRVRITLVNLKVESQKKVIAFSSSMVEAAIVKLLLEAQPESMGIADLGCSSGPNCLAVVSQIIHIVDATCHQLGRRPVPELRVSLNDLPGNDFNDVFGSLPELYKKVKNDYGIEHCYVSGMPGSFYARLFPAKSLHFVHSSMSLHWLSQAPSGLEPKVGTYLNKGKVHLSKDCSTSVVKAYQQQFQEDFSLFLTSRAKEMVARGRMVLSFMSRSSPDPRAAPECWDFWDLLGHALMSMALDGLMEKEMIDSFNIPYYAPSLEEVEYEVNKEGSFVVDDVEELRMDSDVEDSSSLKESSGNRVSKTMRAVLEPMLWSHFHFVPKVMDEVFRRFAKKLDDYITDTTPKSITLVISFMKNSKP